MTDSIFPARFILAADIQLTDPMHITAIEKGRYVADEGRRLRYDSREQGVQLSLTRTLRLANHVEEETNGEETTRRFGREIPVIPSSTVGGKLRNAAAQLIFDSLVQRDLSISTNAYNTLCTGTATTSLDGDKTTPEVVQAARSEPFLANFGGTSFALSARSVISTGLPLIEATREMLMSPPLDEQGVFNMARYYDMTSVVAIVRKDPLRSLSSDTIEEVIAEDELQAYFAELKDKDDKKAINKAKAKEDPANATRDKKTDTRTLNALEVINPGMSFALRVQVDAFSEQQLGLMVLAFQKVLRDGQIGGKAARGFGRFTCKGSRLMQVDQNTNRVIESTLSPLFLDKSSGYAIAGLDNETPTVLTSATMSAQDYLYQLDPSMIEAFASTDPAAIKALLKKGRAEEVA